MDRQNHPNNYLYSSRSHGPQVTNYLIGSQSHLPAISGPQAAVAHLQRSLDGGFFEHTDHSGYGTNVSHSQASHAAVWSSPEQFIHRPTATPALSQVHTQSADESRELEVKVFLPPKKKGDTAKEKILKYRSRNPPPSFISDVTTALEISDGEEFEIGWKTCDDKRNDPYKSLTTFDDVKQAFDESHKILLRRKSRPFFLEIRNTKAVEYNEAKEKKKEKAPEPCEEALTDQLKIARKRFRCSEHSSADRSIYCYLIQSGDDTGKHKEITDTVLSLWCRMVKNGTADAEFKKPPNVLGLDSLQNKAGASIAGGSRRGRSGQDIHVHLDGLSDVLAQRTPRKRVHEVIDIDDNEENTPVQSAKSSPSYTSTPIAKVLESLHNEWPDHNYPQYLEKMREQGLAYGGDLLDFGHDWFEDTIGMKVGAVGTFLRAVSGSKQPLAKRRRTATAPLSPSKHGLNRN